MDVPVKESRFDSDDESKIQHENEFENERGIENEYEIEHENEFENERQIKNEYEIEQENEELIDRENEIENEKVFENENVIEDDEEIENGKEEYSLIPCNYCDIEIVQKLEEILLRGLASACVERTAGDLFKGPVTVSPEISKEMVEFLMEKTELLLSDTIANEDDNLDQIQKASTYPTEYISDSVDNFIASKRNLLSRVSGWISSETREAKIDDVATQISEINNFRSVAEVLLRNMDIKGNFHCPEKFSTEENFEIHKPNCDFRPINCTNDGCEDVFSAINLSKHDLICPYKIIPCEQACGEGIVRYEMEKHCGVDCTMRLVNCPFYQVGCESAFPFISLEKHCADFVQFHLLCVLKSIEREGIHAEQLKQRVQLLEKSQNLNEMSGALDQRSLTLLLKEQEAKTKKLESLIKDQDSKIKKLEKELHKVAKG